MSGLHFHDLPHVDGTLGAAMGASLKEPMARPTVKTSRSTGLPASPGRHHLAPERAHTATAGG